MRGIRPYSMPAFYKAEVEHSICDISEENDISIQKKNNAGKGGFVIPDIPDLERQCDEVVVI